jgi:hypothetical protein
MSGHQLISRDDLDAGRVDFSAVDTGERLPPVHPGDVLQHDFLEPLGVTAHALALALRVAGQPHHHDPRRGARGDRRDGVASGAPFRHQRGVLAQLAKGL